jgi:hypothetical protein
MNDDSSFDPIDPFDPLDHELRRRFDAATPPAAADPDAVLDTLRPRMGQARTRHRVALGGLAAGVVALAAVAGFALTGGTANPHVDTPPATRSPLPGPTVALPPIPTLPDGSASKDSGTNGGGALGDGSASTDGAAASGSSGSSSASGSAGSSGNGETPTTVPATTQQSYSSNGGSITAQLVNGQVSLVSATPAAGATYEVHDDGPDRVEVRFYNSSHDEIARIRVDVVDGALSPTIS